MKILADAGVDVRKPEFWQGGFDVCVRWSTSWKNLLEKAIKQNRRSLALRLFVFTPASPYL